MNDRFDFCKSDLIHLLDLLDPVERGQNLTLNQYKIAMKLLFEKVLNNPVFVDHKLQVILIKFADKTLI